MEGFNWLTGFIFPHINLLLFLFLLVKIAKGPLNTAMNNRYEQYSKALNDANQAKEEAERRSRELEAKLAGLDAEIAEIHSRAKRQAEEESAKILNQAKQLAEHLKQEAQKIADFEVSQARQRLRQEILSQVHSNIVNKVQSEMGQEQQMGLIHRQLTLLPGQQAAEGVR